jgi:sterol desaturase/sphingolipid hydroxylase (fatty acid hydroxylase superfamily)
MLDPKPIAIVICLVLFGWLEIRSPFFRPSLQRWRQMGMNLGVGMVNLGCVTLLVWGWAQVGLSRSPVWSLNLLTHQPIAIASLVLFVILDLYHYLWHRLMHSTRWGWRIHRFHHSDVRMNISTAYRFNTIEILLSYFPKFLLLLAIGIQPEQLILYEVCFAVSLIFHHSNWNLPQSIDRRLSHLLVTPNLHRLHHSTNIQRHPCNFSSLLTLWDHLSHTFHYPKTPHRLKLGLPSRIHSP